MFAVAGVNGKRWDINYFDIKDKQESGDNTLLTISDRINTGEYRLLVDMSLNAFDLIYKQAADHVSSLQESTNKTLSEIQDRHDYFKWSNTKIIDYINIHWTDPVQIEYSDKKELPIEVKGELQERFPTWI